MSAGQEEGREPRRRPWWRRPLLRVLTVAAPPVVSVALRLVQWSLRIEFVDDAELRARWARGEKVIVAFWHDRLMMMPVAAAGMPVCILVSHHRDGEIATRALARWGVHTVRGSASRGAVSGFLRLVDAYRRGYNLAVIPDGPRGPRHVAKPGVVALAKATGSAIFPVSYAASRAARLRSWDRLMIPLPFARVCVAVGEPMTVEPHASEALLEEHRRVLEGRLRELTQAVESRMPAPG